MKILKLSVQQILMCSTFLLVTLTSDSNARHRTTWRNATQGNQHAVADIRPCNNGDDIRGWAHLEEKRSQQGVKKVRVKVILRGWDIPDGEHGVHIHEVANCEPCGSAGGHFDPGPNSNSNPDGNHPFHLGDLVNINVNDGYGEMRTTTTRVTLSDGPTSIFDEDGSAFIIHINSDTFCPNGEEAGCAGGGRLACGIIERAR
jgi:Cu-Zn family superoxide dismutase